MSAKKQGKSPGETKPSPSRSKSAKKRGAGSHPTGIAKTGAGAPTFGKKTSKRGSAKKSAKAAAKRRSQPAAEQSSKKRPPQKATRSKQRRPAARKPLLLPYEQEQIVEIRKWRDREPGVVDKTLGVALEPLAWMVRQVVPEKALMGALGMARKLSTMTVDTADVLRDAQASSVEELRSMDLKVSDRLANEVHNWGIGMAAAEGAGAGAFGIFGAPVDVPALITIALRTIEKIGVCYGYQCKSEEDEQLVFGILAASGSNSVQEKAAALVAVRSIQTTLACNTWKKMAEVAARTPLSREAAITAMRNLAKQLSINITKRKALAAIPFVGALVGGSMNAWYLTEVGWAARRVFQERWLRENGKLIDA